jgi:hypothetical protein
MQRRISGNERERIFSFTPPKSQFVGIQRTRSGAVRRAISWCTLRWVVATQYDRELSTDAAACVDNTILLRAIFILLAPYI